MFENLYFKNLKLQNITLEKMLSNIFLSSRLLTVVRKFVFAHVLIFQNGYFTLDLNLFYSPRTFFKNQPCTVNMNHFNSKAIQTNCNSQLDHPLALCHTLLIIRVETNCDKTIN